MLGLYINVFQQHSTSLLESHLDLTCTCHGSGVASPKQPSLEESSILRPSRPGAAEGEEVPVGALCVIEDSNNGVEGSAFAGYLPSQGGGILRCGLHHRNSLTGPIVAAQSPYDDFPFREAIQAPVPVNRIGEVVVEPWSSPPLTLAVSTATTATQSPPRVTFAMDQQQRETTTDN